VVAASNKRMRSPDREMLESKRRRDKSPSRMREEGDRPLMNHALKRRLEQVRKKREKARSRQKKYVQKLRASAGQMGILELGSVKEPQRRDYAKRLQEFYEFVALHRLPIAKEDELDVALCDYADHMYLNGEGSDAGQKLKAALEFVRPEAIRKSEIHLPRFKRSLKGWRKLAPTQTRLPMIEFVKSSISAIMLYIHQPMMALFNELTFSTYARPGELTRALAIDVVKKNDQFSHDVIVLSPFERAEASKAGIFDEVLILDDTRMMCLGSIVVQEAAQRIRRGGEEAKLWDFTPAQYLQTWRSCVEVLEVGDVAVSPYQNRHGGASRDHLLRLRSVAAIQRRGRWAVDSSARVYDKPGRLQQTINKYSQKLQPLGEQTRARFQDYFYGKPVPLPIQLQQKVKLHFKKQLS